MIEGKLAFTAVYLKAKHGYVGFIEELPGVNSRGHSIEEARQILQKLAAVVFDEERRNVDEMIAGKDVVRESLLIPIPCSSRLASARRASCAAAGSAP